MSPTSQEVRALQYALNRIDRYPSGPVDGIIGPLTRNAIRSYSGSRHVEEAFWPVAAQLSQLVWWRGDWTEAIQAAVDATLTARSQNGRTPRLKEYRLWQGRSANVACVRLWRGGEGWLYLPLRQGWTVPTKGAASKPILIADPPVAVPKETRALWCALGYVNETGPR